LTDTVRGFSVFAERSEAIRRATNLGTGESCIVRKIVQPVRRLLTRSFDVRVDPNPLHRWQTEVVELCADVLFPCGVAWRPESSLERGVRQVLDFLRQFMPEPGAGSPEYRI